MIASCAPCCWIFGVPDVCAIHQIHTYRTKFFDNLLLNELLNPSCKCAVVRNDVVSVRVYNCNMALTVNFARADQSFVDVCLPTLAGPSLYAQKPPRWEMSSPEAVLQLQSFACVSMPVLASSGNAEIAAPVSISTNLRDLGAVI